MCDKALFIYDLVAITILFKLKMAFYITCTSILIIALFLWRYFYLPVDLTIIGSADMADGLGSQGPTQLSMVAPSVSANYCTMGKSKNLEGVEPHIQSIIRKPCYRLGKVSIFDAPLFSLTGKNYQRLQEKKDLGRYIDFGQGLDKSTSFIHHIKSIFYRSPPKDKRILLTYTMYESSQIPPEWTEMINNHFDVAILPDRNLEPVYLRSGVTKPIFIIPLAIPDLNRYLDLPLKRSRSKTFTFSCLGTFCSRKDQVGILKAFIKQFKNHPDVSLVLHGRCSLDHTFDELKDLIKRHNVKNVSLSRGAISRNAYIEKLQQTDCLINVSTGEGFSIQPREAMALGIPLVLSDVLAQSTICPHPIVEPVTAKHKEPFYRFFNKDQGHISDGYQMRSDEDEIGKAIFKMYHNYDKYLKHSDSARKWTRQYLPKSLAPYYYSIIKPKSIALGEKNEVSDQGLTTTSKELLEKYKRVLS